MVNGGVMFEFRTWYAVYHCRSTFRMATVLYHRRGMAIKNALLCKSHGPKWTEINNNNNNNEIFLKREPLTQK